MAGARTRTAVLEAPRKLRIVERDRPAAGPDEVIIRTAATAVCHTDLSIYTGEHPGVKYPVVMGHEATGVVEATGENVTRLKRGQHVLINPIIACGHCDMCERGKGNLCRNAGLFGREIEGSLSEVVRLDQRYVHALPPQLSLAHATIIETLATVRHAQHRVSVAPAESVVVLGMGTAGLLHVRLAVLTGASPVIAVSRSRWKLERAERMGAHFVIDAAGGAETLRSAIEMLRAGGRFSAFAVSHAHVKRFSTFPLYFGEISIVGSRALTPQDMNPSIELAAAGAVDVSGFITEKYPLSRAREAFREYESNPSRILRIVIES